MSAGAADRRTRTAATVDEEQALLAPAQPLVERLNEPARENPTIAARELRAQIHDVHRGKRLARRALAQFEQRDAAGLRRCVAFERRRRAAEQQQAFLAPHALACHRHGVVARNGLLLVRLVVRLVHDEQRHVPQRREYCAARADDDVDLAARAGLPGVEALAVRQRGVQHCDAPPKGGLEASRDLRRQRYLRNEHDRAPAVRDDAFDRLDVDVRLPAAGHAV